MGIIIKILEIYYKFEWEMGIGASEQVVKTKEYKLHDSREQCMFLNTEHLMLSTVVDIQ